MNDCDRKQKVLEKHIAKDDFMEKVGRKREELRIIKERN